MAEDKALTVPEVRAAKPKEKRYSIADRDVPGMRLVIFPSGKKSYVIMTRVNGKLVTFTLGNAALLTLADAREKGRTILRRIGNGEDPRATKQEAIRAEAETVEAVARQYIEDYAKLRTKTWRDLELQFEGELIPRWGKRPISSITKRDIPLLTKPIVARGSLAMANRIFETVRRLFSWAVDQDLIESSPFERKKKPAPKPPSRERVLGDNELALIWQAADALGYPTGPILQLLTLTGARRSEIAEMSWSELSPDMTTWTLPRERAKNRRALELPLPRLARSILVSVPRVNDSDFVFTASGERPINSFRDACRRINRMIEAVTGKSLSHWTVHDLRRTAATNLERVGVLPHVIESILNHVVPGVAGVYRRYDYKPEKAEALELLAKHVETLVAEAPKMTEALKMTARVYRMLTVENIRELNFSGTNQQRKLIRDSGGPDLFLSISGSGKKTWVLLRRRNGQKFKTLGPVDLSGADCRKPTMGKPLSPEAARALAHKMASESART